MRSPDTLDRLRVQLRAVIAYRDAHGLTDAVADRLNDLECMIAAEERRQGRRQRRGSWLSEWMGAGRVRVLGGVL